MNGARPNLDEQQAEPARAGSPGVPANQPSTLNSQPPPPIPDHELLRCIGRGSYGEVWLARNILGEHRAVKIVHRSTFEDERPFEREFKGNRRFEPISRSHPSQLNILHVGRGEGCFYYVMELADGAEPQRSNGVMESWSNGRTAAAQHSSTPALHHSMTPPPTSPAPSNTTSNTEAVSHPPNASKSAWR